MWQRKKLSRVLAIAVAAGFLSLPAWGSTSEPRTAMPGTVNYVEGQASIGDQILNSKSADLQAGQTLDTENGKAEVLLTPGVFLRLGANSSVEMISPNLTNTQLAVNKGEALVEVDEIHPENNIRINEDGSSTRLLKTGLYDFDASNHQVRVFSGKASVLDGDRTITVKGGHELALNTNQSKAKGFDKDKYAKNDDLYRWSSLRSDYLAEANVDAARTYVANDWYGPGWWGGGWYWSPWFGSYTFIPASGFLYSPFGWGYYSPFWASRVPVYGHGHDHQFGNFRPEPRGRLGPGPAHGPGFRGGAVHSFGGHAERGEMGGGRNMHAAIPFSGFHGGPIAGGSHGGFSGGGHRR